jgi:hypothetical protein
MTIPLYRPLRGRPRFRFSLRTKFVVLTVFSLWFGWQAKIVRERREALAELKWVEGTFYSTSRLKSAHPPYEYSHEAFEPTVPFWRRCLGDEPVAEVQIPKTFKFDERRLRELFPGVRIARYDPEEAAQVRNWYGKERQHQISRQKVNHLP